MKKILFAVLCLAGCTTAEAQFMGGLNTGYAAGQYYNKPYVGAAMEVGFLRSVRVGINAEVILPRTQRTPTSLYYKDDNSLAEEGTTTTLKYFTFSPEFFIKRYFGRQREYAYNGFYFGMGFSYKMFKYNQTVAEYNSGVYNCDYKAEDGSINHPFMSVLFGYEMAAGPGNLGVELKIDGPVNEVNGRAIEVLLPPMLKLGVTYRFGNFRPKW